MTSPIERLPVEVFEIVAAGLDLPAYQHLRLASRQLHSLTLSPYAKRYFAELTTTLGSPSLDRLVNISKHGYYRHSVVFLDIKLLTDRDYQILTNIQKVGIYPPPKRFPLVPGIEQKHISGEATLYDDVVGPKYPQCITERLTRVLEGLSNCKRMRFRAHHSEPAGWQSIDIPYGDQLFRARCFAAVFDSIAASKLQLEDFSMAKKTRNGSLRKCADVAGPKLSCSYPSQLQHSFAHLKSLTITAVTAPPAHASHELGYVLGWETELSRFIGCAPNLKSLTLSLDRRGHLSYHSASVVRSIALSCRLESLETLQLINCVLCQADLLHFLAVHAASLASISLENMALLPLSWNWEMFWVSLGAISGLRRIRLAELKGPSGPIHLGAQKKTKIVLDANKAGRPMRELLDELVIAAREDESYGLNGGDVP